MDQDSGATSAASKRPSNWPSCYPECPCQKIQSDEAAIGAVDSDERTRNLIEWLSGAERDKKIDASESPPDLGNEIFEPTYYCGNRLQASIAILNAIRDACRPFLESAPLSSSVTSSSPSRPKSLATVDAATYESSFPSLSSSTLSSTAPTILVGRKKNKDQKRNAYSSVAGKNGTKVNVGAPSNNTAKAPEKQKNWNAPASSTKSTSSLPNQYKSGKGTGATAKSKQRIRPVTVSLSSDTSAFPPLSSSALPSDKADHCKLPKLNGNISSLPSQDTSEMIKAVTKNQSNHAGQKQQTNVVKKLAIKMEGTKMNETSDKKINAEFSGVINNLAPTERSYCATAEDLNKQSSQTNALHNKIGVEEIIHERSNLGTTDLKPTALIGNGDVLSHPRMPRLVGIYSTILRHHLAPFLLLELHLLVRLLSISDKTNKNQMNGTKNDSSNFFASVFESEEACRNFAAQTLTALEFLLVNLGHETIKLFATLPAMQQYCPKVVLTLQSAIDAGNSNLMFESDQKALGANSNTPHLTLPFDHARDSRHNYRTVDLNRLFKEREELRDSFLYQLRAFQDVRGKLMDHERADRVIQSIKSESREMLKNLAPGNILWFVQFFCDLLLQIGLVPIGETDSEVLSQITDQKRLQKLHMRFTAKSGQTSKSSHKLIINEKGTSSDTGTSSPDQYFLGHQEFFYLFLRASDSFKFNNHLKQKLIGIITEMSSSNEIKGLCQRTSKLQMLAKFLGLLVFGPNWNLSATESRVDSFTCTPPFDIKFYVEAAWSEYRLTLVIPWVVQYLLMMQWDSTSKLSKCYKEIFSFLRVLSYHCRPSRIKGHDFLQTNMVLISLQLDSLFNDVVGLTATQNLSLINLPGRVADIHSSEDQTKIKSDNSSDAVWIDALPLWFSKSFLFSSCTYLVDLSDLLNDFTHSIGKFGGGGSSKKRGLLKESELQSSWQKSTSRIALSSGESQQWPSNRLEMSKHGGIEDKLVDSFFHQHKELQQICEMVADRVLKNFGSTVLQDCISPIFQQRAMDYESYFNPTTRTTLDHYKAMIEGLKVESSLAARSLMNDDFERVIKQSLSLLSPPSTNPKVLEIASSLSLNHALRRGDTVSVSHINDEAKKMIDDFIRKEKKVNAGVPLSATKKREDVRSNSNQSANSNSLELLKLVQALEYFHGSKYSDGDEFDNLKLAVDVTVNRIRCLDSLFVTEVSEEISLHACKIEALVVSMLKDYTRSSATTAVVLQAAIEVTKVLSLLKKSGCAVSCGNALESVLSNSDGIICFTCEGSSEDALLAEKVGEFLFLLVEGSLVSHRSIEKSLLISFGSNSHVQIVSKVIVGRLSNSIVMPRLAKKLATCNERIEANDLSETSQS